MRTDIFTEGTKVTPKAGTIREYPKYFKEGDIITVETRRGKPCVYSLHIGKSMLYATKERFKLAHITYLGGE